MGVKSKKSFFDAIDFDEIGDSMDLWWNTIQNSFEFDAISDKDEFLARVISPPVPLGANNRELAAFGMGSKSSGSVDTLPKFTFRARMTEVNSHHVFWPDPCDPRYVEDVGGQDNAVDWIRKHLKVLAINATEVPRVGDTVRIKLINQGVYTSNPENAIMIGSVTSLEGIPASVLNTLELAECKTRISELFENYRPGGAASTEGKNGDRDDPPFTKCAPAVSPYSTLPEKRGQQIFYTEKQRVDSLKKISGLGTDEFLRAAVLSVMLKEQPKSMPDNNPAGIQGDNASWGSAVNKHVSYVSCVRDSEKFRIFLGFDTLDAGIAAVYQAFVNKGFPAYVNTKMRGKSSKEAADALTVWYYKNWNLAATDAEIAQLRASGRFPSRSKPGEFIERDFDASVLTFKETLELYAPTAFAPATSPPSAPSGPTPTM